MDGTNSLLSTLRVTASEVTAPVVGISVVIIHVDRESEQLDSLSSAMVYFKKRQLFYALILVVRSFLCSLVVGVAVVVVEVDLAIEDLELVSIVGQVL